MASPQEEGRLSRDEIKFEMKSGKKSRYRQGSRGMPGQRSARSARDTVWPPPPRGGEAQTPQPSPLLPLLPLTLTVAGCYGIALYGPLIPGIRGDWLPRVMVLTAVGYVLSLVLGVLFIRRVVTDAFVAAVLWLLLVGYALLVGFFIVFPWVAIMATRLIGP